ncbi:ATP-binding protein [Parendozoicomonas haliclonae]|nr:ATP-binding protein [Parendozoicomonas haliclonae]
MIVASLVVLFLAQVITAAMMNAAHKSYFQSSTQGWFIDRTVLLTQKLVATSPSNYDIMSDAASAPFAIFRINSHPYLTEDGSDKDDDALSKLLESRLGSQYSNQIRSLVASGDKLDEWKQACLANLSIEAQPCITSLKEGKKRIDMGTEIYLVAVSIPLPNKQWLNIFSMAPVAPIYLDHDTILFLSIFGVLQLIAILILVRRITRPLKSLAIASDKLGKGESVALLEESGPEDVRRTIRAFNRMNNSLVLYMKERTGMLASIAHDLRTPLTGLKIRTEMLPDSRTKTRLLSTIGEMQNIVETTVQFIRENQRVEQPRRVDINALLESLSEDFQEMGQNVVYSPAAAPIAIICQPVGMGRALRNLIENAVKYGHRARISLLQEEQHVVINIDDDGPGIDDNEIERVFEAFFRSEKSRSRETGGLGLGLAIVQNILHAHHGEISLHNRKEGGLNVKITLPYQCC